MSDEEQIGTKLIELETEHRDLDDAIRSMEDGVYVDQIQLKRLKKKKLQNELFRILHQKNGKRWKKR